MKRTVLITGASTGFGRDTARVFSQRGWNVIATMRDPAAGAELAALPDVLVARLDVQDTGSIAAAITAGVARFGGLDCVVNNAGFGLYGVFEATPAEKIREQFAVNVFGAMDVTRAALPHLRARGGGTILNISSGAGVFTLPMLSLYSASKFALEGFSESLAYELAPQGIIVKIIEPGGVVSTGFVSRSASEAAHAPPPPAYAGFVAHAERLFAGLRGDRTGTSAGVAEVIFGAATDGTRQLRYVATPGIVPLVTKRRETSEAAYIDYMRATFEDPTISRT
jgi:NAD(P)-dependent dehydrogenase (short-subunit alcohol dehydrogenase family)